MRANKTLLIKFEDWDHFKDRVTKALRSREVSIGRRDVLVWRSAGDYQNFMTEQKLAILAYVASRSPKSIYALAQLVGRDFANVQRDCVALCGHGFMKFKESGDAKKSKIPKLAFNYTKIVVQMPGATYSHVVGKVA
jgi:predicted transcriptional regulator